MESQQSTAKCPKCKLFVLEENEQSNLQCPACGYVQETLAFSGALTFANQKMDGQVVDLNGTPPPTQRSTTAGPLRSGWPARRPRWRSCGGC